MEIPLPRKGGITPVGKFFILFFAVVFAITLAFQLVPFKALNDKEKNDDKKVTICHATSADDHYTTLHTSINAINGHFENNGTPLSGHELDLLLDGWVDCPGTIITPTPTPSDTPTPTPTSTPTPTPTPTETPTPTPSDSATPTPSTSITPTPSDSDSPTPTPSNNATPTPSSSQTSTPTPGGGGGGGGGGIGFTTTPTPSPTNTSDEGGVGGFNPGNEPTPPALIAQATGSSDPVAQTEITQLPATGINLQTQILLSFLTAALSTGIMLVLFERRLLPQKIINLIR